MTPQSPDFCGLGPEAPVFLPRGRSACRGHKRKESRGRSAKRAFWAPKVHRKRLRLPPGGIARVATPAVETPCNLSAIKIHSARTIRLLRELGPVQACHTQPSLQTGQDLFLRGNPRQL